MEPRKWKTIRFLILFLPLIAAYPYHLTSSEIVVESDDMMSSSLDSKANAPIGQFMLTGGDIAVSSASLSFGANTNAPIVIAATDMVGAFLFVSFVILGGGLAILSIISKGESQFKVPIFLLGMLTLLIAMNIGITDFGLNGIDGLYIGSVWLFYLLMVVYLLSLLIAAFNALRNAPRKILGKGEGE